MITRQRSRWEAFLVLASLAEPHSTNVNGFHLGDVGSLGRCRQNVRPDRLILASTSTPLIAALDPNQRKAPKAVEILSQDPLVYSIPNLLSPQECQDLLQRAEELEQSRPMKQSNPPAVSLDIRKLWPLPFLSIGAGIPPILRNLEETSTLPSPGLAFSLALPPIVIALALSALLAFVAVPFVQRISDSKARTSLAMAWNQKEDIPYVRALVDRVCESTQHSWQDWEAPVFTRYPPGAIFSKHSDASPTRGSEWEDEGGQRVVTCICYLNTVAKGGETSFDQLGITVPPKQGSALVFFPSVVGNSLEADDCLTHESLAVEEGEKCIVQMFGRVGPRVPPPLGLPDAYGDD
jgi:hypothetical protein